MLVVIAILLSWLMGFPLSWLLIGIAAWILAGRPNVFAPAPPAPEASPPPYAAVPHYWGVEMARPAAPVVLQQPQPEPQPSLSAEDIRRMVSATIAQETPRAPPPV